MSQSDRVAVVGMAVIFPGAPDLETYWKNICGGVDAISDVPEGRWDPVFYDPTSRAADRLYCKRGGFVDAYATFDALRFGVMPVAARSAEPDQLLALEVAARAIADAGYESRPFERERAGVILGRGGYASAGRTRLEQHVRAAEQLVVSLRSLLPNVSEADLARVKAEFQAQAPAGGADAIGLVPNLAASRLAHQLDLAGPAFTVDAACASSLVAIDQACRELSSGRTDLMLAGGIHLCQDESFWSVFCQLGALSRAQQIRPFDRNADGLLIGEGVGIVVLKRLADAERDDDRIYAVVRGSGIASDGRRASLMAPAAEGQITAIERAWKDAELDPRTVGLVEGHGTATPAGDAAELETLRRAFGEGERRAVLGSVKSMIGHTMPAAGVAGFVKAALAIHHGVLPPTIHCESPHEALERTRFRLIAKEEPWEGGPRRAGVNAFGFGGINAHVVLEEHAAPRVARSVARTSEPSIALFAAESKEALLADLERNVHGSSGSVRLAVVDPTPERLARAKTIVEKGRPWRTREGIWFSPSSLAADGGRVALLFPGVDASFEPHVEDVAERFGFPVPPCTRPKNLEETGLGIIGVNRLLHRVLAKLGVAGDFVAGHSIGEWSAMIATGMLTAAETDEFIAKLRPGSLEVPDVFFAAAGCGVDAAREAMRGLEDIDVSHDNCPHQILLCGRGAAIDTAVARLREAGVLTQKLSFQSGFHSPLIAPYLSLHREHILSLEFAPPQKPFFSATTCAEYPSDVAGIRALTLDHLVRPVRFREMIEALYARGARIFVQVGTGSLVHFVEDVLRGRPHVAVSANVKDQTGLAQLRRLAATLFVEGVDVDLGALFSSRKRHEPMKLSLGVPLVRSKTPLAVGPAPRVPVMMGKGPLAEEFARTMVAIADAQADVLAALERVATGPREATMIETLSIDTHPELLDHTFFRQPKGWPNVSDRHPVVPMTTSIEIMKEAAERLVPERKVIALESIRAYRWLVVSKPVEVAIHARFDGVDRVAVAIDGYAEAVCILGEEYSAAPSADRAPLEKEKPCPHGAGELYRDGWMFHGPAFQGVVDIGAVGSDGIRGTLASPQARGALLDNAGQLFGFWVMLWSEKDRLAMPVKMDRIDLYGPHPKPGERLECTVRIREYGAQKVVADLSLDRDGKTWARITGWEDRRFETDPRLWAVMMFPEKNVLSEPQDGWVLLVDRYRSAPTRDQLARRFLGEAERAQYEAQGPRKQRAWLSGRIAAKDAIRDLLWREGHGALFPVEVTIETDEAGRPRVHAPSLPKAHVSLAHKDDVAVAIASVSGEVGIDIERVEPRTEGFIELSFTADELALKSENDDEHEWLTRLWVAKEAVAKATGEGLGGNPRRFAASDRAGDRLLVAGRWVTLRRWGDYVIGWTQP